MLLKNIHYWKVKIIGWIVSKISFILSWYKTKQKIKSNLGNYFVTRTFEITCLMLRIAVPFLRSLFLCLGILIRKLPVISRQIENNTSRRGKIKRCLSTASSFYLDSRMLSFERRLVKAIFFVFLWKGKRKILNILFRDVSFIVIDIQVLKILITRKLRLCIALCINFLSFCLDTKRNKKSSST